MNSVHIVGPTGQIKFGKSPRLTADMLSKSQVLIKVEASAINPSDILFMRGKYTGLKC